MGEQQYDFGMIGLGTMGRNLVFNMADHGFSVSGFDQDSKQVDNLEKEKGARPVHGTRSPQEFVASLKQPRVIMLLVPAGKIVDAVVAELKPLLSNEDLIMDCGNSHYTDTDVRTAALAKENIHFMGVGVSGGEQGARFGPSIMPGGNKSAYDRVAPMLEAVSAKVNGNEPCVTYLGAGSSGHYVKMVHNGIEYGLMQLISETYQILKEAGGLSNDELYEVYKSWNEGRLQSFLISITADIFNQKDELTSNRLIDMILDSAGQKGTGAWTSEDAMALQVPIPVIDAAVTARNLSGLKDVRVLAQQKLKGPEGPTKTGKKELISLLEQAMYFSTIVTYAQGMALLQRASKEYNYGLNLAAVAKIWRGGCIIRASLLEQISNAYTQQTDIANLILSDVVAAELAGSQSGIRKLIGIAAEAGIPVPGIMASLAYYDTYRHGWLPANLLQAQRDYFGAHTYKRNDREGVFHSHWNQKGE